MRKASRRRAVARVLPRACIIAGRRNSLRPARSVLPATRPDRPVLTRQQALRAKTHDLKEALAEQLLENRPSQKSMIGDGGKQERDIPHPKSSRSSAWLNSPISAPGRHCRCSAFRRRNSIVSIIVIVHSARLASKIATATLARSGTASQMISVPILLIWLSIRPICNLGN